MQDFSDIMHTFVEEIESDRQPPIRTSSSSQAQERGERALIQLAELGFVTMAEFISVGTYLSDSFLQCLLGHGHRRGRPAS